MNTKQTRQIRTAAIASAFVVVMTMVASPASAQPPRRDDGSARTSGAEALGYGTAMTGLDGQSLAQYLQAHQESDPRTATVI